MTLAAAAAAVVGAVATGVGRSSSSSSNSWASQLHPIETELSTSGALTLHVHVVLSCLQQLSAAVCMGRILSHSTHQCSCSTQSTDSSSSSTGDSRCRHVLRATGASAGVRSVGSDGMGMVRSFSCSNCLLPVQQCTCSQQHSCIDLVSATLTTARQCWRCRARAAPASREHSGGACWVAAATVRLSCSS